MTPIRVEYPGKLVSLNVMLRSHKMRQASRAKHERQAAWAECLKACGSGERPEFPLAITVTRIAPRKLDAHDNLGASMKATIDGIADYLRIRDNDPRVTFKTAEAYGGVRKYRVRIDIEARVEEPAVAA